MARAEFYILTLNRFFVNAVLPLMLILSVASGCGFQLNRNKILLPDNARSISITKIKNNSYVPRLNIQLRDLLDEKLAQNSIMVTTGQSADLALSFTIDSIGSTRRDYSLTDETQSYEFLFSVRGKLTVKNNVKQSVFLNNLPITGSYSLIAETQDLTQSESEEGRYKAVTDLSNKIITKLTQNF